MESVTPTPMYIQDLVPIMSSNTWWKRSKINNLGFFEIPPIKFPPTMYELGQSGDSFSHYNAWQKSIVLFKSGLQRVEASNSWFHNFQTHLRRLWREQEPWVRATGRTV